jgi:hypothetical protein
MHATLLRLNGCTARTLCSFDPSSSQWRLYDGPLLNWAKRTLITTSRDELRSPDAGDVRELPTGNQFGQASTFSPEAYATPPQRLEAQVRCLPALRVRDPTPSPATTSFRTPGGRGTRQQPTSLRDTTG